jgi:hypothetical protein
LTKRVTRNAGPKWMYFDGWGTLYKLNVVSCKSAKMRWPLGMKTSNGNRNNYWLW